MALDIRVVADSEFDAWSDALDVGFYHPENRGRGAFRRTVWADTVDAGRVIGAFDGTNVVGTYQHFATALTVPGGSVVANAITTVTVTPTHRRRGILTSMMALGLGRAVELGEPVSILIPAEWPIYGRYGYGVATEEAQIRVDATRASLARPVPGTVELVSAEQFCVEAPLVYERIRAATPGAIEMSENRWRREAGLLTHDGKPTDKERLFALVRDEAGTPRGYASYKLKEDKGRDFRPNATVEAQLRAETAEARVRLLQYLWEHDWAVQVDAESQPIDDSWRLLLRDARMAAQDFRNDVVWVRLLDVAAALSQRTYENEGRLVIAVSDKDGFAEGVFALEGGPEGATCTRSTENPDLTLPVQTLGSLFLGGYAATSMAALGLVSEDRAGALAIADRMFKTAVPPYAPTWF